MPAVDEKLRGQFYSAHRFVVDVNGERQAVFTECSLPSIEWDVEEVKEGGLNVYIHMLPGMRKSTRISLKNGLGKSKLMSWYIDTMKEKFTRKPVTITLLNSQGQPVCTWHIADAYPVKWSGPQLKADTSAIAIQTLDLACGEISIEAA